MLWLSDAVVIAICLLSVWLYLILKHEALL